MHEIPLNREEIGIFYQIYQIYFCIELIFPLKSLLNNIDTGPSSF